MRIGVFAGGALEQLACGRRPQRRERGNDRTTDVWTVLGEGLLECGDRLGTTHPGERGHEARRLFGRRRAQRDDERLDAPIHGLRQSLDYALLKRWVTQLGDERARGLDPRPARKEGDGGVADALVAVAHAGARTLDGLVLPELGEGR